MDKKTFNKFLSDHGACSDAKAWGKNKSLRQAYETCNRADWFLWFFARLPNFSKETVLQGACDCAETALKYVAKGEDRPMKAIYAARVAIAFPTEANKKLAQDAANAAYDAYDAYAYAANAAYATYAAAKAAAYAANAAYTANAATYANAYAANAAYTANAAANAANAAAKAAKAAKAAAYDAYDAYAAYTANAAAAAANAAAYAAANAGSSWDRGFDRSHKEMCDILRARFACKFDRKGGIK